MPVAFRSVIQIDDQLFNAGQSLFPLLPPKKNTVSHEVAGLVMGAKKQERFSGDRLQNAARHQFFLGAHIMIQGVDRHDPA